MMVVLSVGLGGLAAGAAHAQDEADRTVFVPDQVATYDLTFYDPADWQTIVDNPQNQTVWYRARLVWKGSEILENVAVRPAGQATANPGDPKPSLRLDFDEFVPGGRFHGLSGLKLDALRDDDTRTLMTERLYYQVTRDMGVKSPRYVHGRLRVNGTGPYMIYGVEERINKGFVRKHWGTPENQLYKEAAKSGGPKNMNWRGTDPGQYIQFPPNYAEPGPFKPVFTDAGDPPVDGADVVRLHDTLNNNASQAGTVFDVDSFVRLLAVDNVMVNKDGYLDGGYGGTSTAMRNIRLYKTPAGKYVIIPWDASTWWFANRTAAVQEAVDWGLDGHDVTLRVVLSNASNYCTYRQRVKQVIDGPFETARMGTFFDSTAALIDAAVQADPHKQYTHSEWLSNVSAGKTFVRDRNDFVRGRLTGDVRLSVSATDSSAAEAGSATGTFTITRSGSTGGAILVRYAVGGTAAAGSDYQALSGTVTIARSATTATVTVTPLDDSQVEGSETVVLTLTPDDCYGVGTSSSATVTIADNDTGPALPSVTVSATDASAAEPSNTGTFTVSRTGATTASLTVAFAVGGTATAGSDYAALPGSVTIPAGADSAAITVTPRDDTAAEGSETVILTVSSSSSYTVGTPSGATVTIADDDGPPSQVTAAFQDGTAGYAGTRDTYLSQNAPTTNFGGDTSVRADGDEVAGSDLAALLRFDLTSIPPGSSLQSVTLALNVTNPSAGTYELYEAKRAWVEREATWDGYAAGQAWEAAGAQGAQDRGTTVLATIQAQAAGAYTLAFTAAGVAAAQGWVDAAGTNYGVVIANTSNGDGLAFESREAGTGANRPKLTIVYTPGPPPPDTDGDGMTDVAEVAAGFDPGNHDQDGNGTLDGQDDWDGDGVTNQAELAAGSPPGRPPGGAGAGGGNGGGCGATGWEAALLAILAGLHRPRVERRLRRSRRRFGGRLGPAVLTH
jgi:hypothetical protein